MAHVDYDEPFGVWVSRKVAETGMSQRAASREMGVTPGLLNSWIKGHRRPSPESIRKLAAFLAIPEEEVMIRAGLRRRRDTDMHPLRAELIELARQVPLSEARVCADFLRHRTREAMAGRGMDTPIPAGLPAGGEPDGQGG